MMMMMMMMMVVVVVVITVFTRARPYSVPEPDENVLFVYPKEFTSRKQGF
jgi:branched-subunit amino acid transport protein AzlD